MTTDPSVLAALGRIKGLDHEQLVELKRVCEAAIQDIRDGGRIDMWVVTDGSWNLHWDTSYARACHYLIQELQESKKATHQSTYELRKVRVFVKELKEYEDSYGLEWKKLQAALDAESTEAA